MRDGSRGEVRRILFLHFDSSILHFLPSEQAWHGTLSHAFVVRTRYATRIHLAGATTPAFFSVALFTVKLNPN